MILARPEHRNAQSALLLREVDAAFAEAVADPGVKVIVLSGEGEAFSSGHDLGTPDQVAWREEHWTAPTEVEANFRYSWDHFVDMSLRWRDLPKPTFLRMAKLSVNQAKDAMGFRTAIHGAHPHYLLSQLANTEWARQRAKERGGEYQQPNRMPLVQRLLGDERST